MKIQIQFLHHMSIVVSKHKEKQVILRPKIQIQFLHHMSIVVSKYKDLQSKGIIVIKSKKTRVITYICRYSSALIHPDTTELYGLNADQKICRCRRSPLFPYFLYYDPYQLWNY